MPQAIPAIIIAAGQVAATVAVEQIIATFVVNVAFEFRDDRGDRWAVQLKERSNG
jgi:hypothetical protein